ncbi:MAG: hypothetical protein OIF57_04815 [Marinobacterium sp.]|nr:hypothetical protein [Marinobacterium sp.]
MQEREIKLLFNAGVFESCLVVPVSMARGWTLKFLAHKGEVMTLNLQRSKGEREFKSLDGAAAVARRIGFDWVNVQLGDIHWKEKV